MKKVSSEMKILTLLLFPIIVLAILHHMVTGFTIYNDGLGYYSYVRSIAIDHDVDFQNEWKWYNQSFSKFSDVPRGVNFPETRTPTGKIDNVYLIGSSLMWSPFFLAAHIPSLILNRLGMNIQADGYGLQYEIAIGVANIIYGFIGVLLIYKLCRRWFSRKISFLAAATTWYGTALIWYHAIEPSMAHMNSVLLTTLFVYIWYSTLDRRTRLQWILLGVILGLIYLVRQQEILFGLLIGFEWLGKLIPKIDFNRIKTAFFEGMLFGIGLLATLIPQMFVWKSLQGSYIAYSYSQTDGYWYWTFPQLHQIFISGEAGMWRVPAMVLGLLGIILLARRTKNKAIWYFFAIMLADMIVTSAWTGWTYGYGIRFLLGLSVFFALGLGEIFERFSSRFGNKLSFALAAVLIAANFLNMLTFLLGEVASKVPITEISGVIMRILFG